MIKKACTSTIIGTIKILKMPLTHLCSEKHSPTHRRIVGVVVAGIGFLLTQVSSEIHILHGIAEFCGVTIHAIGLVPILSELEKIS